MLSPAFAMGIIFSACQPTRNFTTYFNLFYNMERIMDEVEEELLYIREMKTPEPVFYVPYDEMDRRGSAFYPHLERRSMSNDEMRANKIKLDSILIKGSKLMARHANSDYLDDGIFYIGKAYFYLREWFQSQQKCEELINGFPESKWQPDAHLVLSMDMLQQGNISGAETMLSRTIDVAWAFRRRDVLIEAFRLNADLQLSMGNVAEALRPYQRAMLLSSDGEERARWQYEMALIHFRQGDFEKALVAFDSVDEYSPDVLTEFQTGLQRAASLRVLGKFERAEDELDDLGDNTNYEPWWGMVELERLNLAAARPGATAPPDSAYAQVDSLSPGRNYSTYAVYERGVRALRAGDYQTAQESFHKVRAVNAPFQRRAQHYSSLLDRYFEQTNKAMSLVKGYTPFDYADSVKIQVAEAYYNTARIFAALDITDSLLHYYDLSYKWAPDSSAAAARVVYAWSVMARDSGRSARADSLLEVLVQNYELTDYAADARQRLGYTDNAKRDPAADLYKSGRSFMETGDNQRAMTQFKKVIDGYPESSYAPQAYYAIGLIFEERLDNPDSALAYYGRIVNLYPRSEQAVSVMPLLQAVNLQRMRQPHSAPGNNDGSDANMDWMKENPPLENTAEQPGLVPLDPRYPQQNPPVSGPAGTNTIPPRSVDLNGQSGQPFQFTPQGVDPVAPPPGNQQQPPTNPEPPPVKDPVIDIGGGRPPVEEPPSDEEPD